MKTKLMIQSYYPSLTKTEKRIADAILSDVSNSIIKMTLSELSTQLEVGEASILRFCYKLNFSGFQDFKIAIASDIQQDTSSTSLNGNKTVTDMIRVLENSYEMIDKENLDKVVELIDESEHVFFYGIGSSGFAAEIIEERLLRVGKRCTAITDSHKMNVNSAISKKEDLICAISISGETPDLFRSLETAKQHGATVVAITNHIQSAIANLSDYVLLTKGAESPLIGGNFNSIISQIFVLSLVCDGYIGLNTSESAEFRSKTAKSLSKNILDKK